MVVKGKKEEVLVVVVGLYGGRCGRPKRYVAGLVPWRRRDFRMVTRRRGGRGLSVVVMTGLDVWEGRKRFV